MTAHRDALHASRTTFRQTLDALARIGPEIAGTCRCARTQPCRHCPGDVRVVAR